MKKKPLVLLLIILVLLLSLTVNGCKKSEDPGNSPAQRPTAEKNTEAKQDQGSAASSAAQDNPNANIYTNNVSTDKKASLITLVKVQVTSAAGNPNPFHVSLDGQVGASALRLIPGNSTLLQKEVYQTGNKYPVTLTISRNGEAVAVLNQNLNSSNVSIVITEIGLNQFNAQWN